MKKFLPVLFGLLVSPAFAEVAPVYYEYDEAAAESPLADEVPGIAADDVRPDAAVPAIAAKPATPVVSPRATAARSAVRAVPSSQSSQGGASRSAPSRAVASRNAAASVRSLGLNPEKSLAARATGANNVNTARAGSLMQTNTTSAPLYNPARVSVRGSSVGALAGARMGTSLFGGTTSSTPAIEPGTSMEELAQVTDFCRAQFYACMDGFCDTLDDNQGRCSCSGNINNYKKSEDALKKATEELQDVAIKIQYLGLTKEEVISLFSQTEAEEAMSSTQDTTQLRNDLEKIKKMVLDVKGGSSSSTGIGGLDFGSLDLTLDNGFDLSSFFNFGDNTIANQRGAELFKTATTRCKASVLDTCKKQGVDTNLISNGYDLEIDKQCIMYERALEDSNDQMKRTVRNATMVLQKARLAVAQTKNAYDMRGCVSALDSCMQSEFVCGSDYDSCLDPTGKYIVKGEIVMGVSARDIRTGLNAAWGGEMTGAWGSMGLPKFIRDNVGKFNPDNMVGFLESKIGENKSGKDTGMCMTVLNKCQNYTYTNNRKSYDNTNVVVKEYLSQALTQIKAHQETLLADYGSSCKSDLLSCLISNGGQIGDNSGQNVGFLSAAIFNACKSVASICANTLSDSDFPMTAEALAFDMACSTADISRGDGSVFPNTKVAKAWVIGSATSSKNCYCPYDTSGNQYDADNVTITDIGTPKWYMTWSNAAKTCSCPQNSNWYWETGECQCMDGYAWHKNNKNTCVPACSSFPGTSKTGSGGYAGTDTNTDAECYCPATKNWNGIASACAS